MIKKLIERRLIKNAHLINISPEKRPFNLFIPENQKWTFSENDYYEENVAYWLETILKRLARRKRNLIFYDIGTNCGYYSLLASQKATQIHAFEPSQETHKIASLNLRRNGVRNVQLHQVALTNKSGELIFHTYSSSGNDSLVKRHIPKGHELKYVQHYKVTANKLDAYVEEQALPLPSFIKMDIEGAELFALQGSTKTLSKAGLPPVIVEYSKATSEDAGYRREDIKKLLLDLGYAIFATHEDNKTKKLIRLSKDGANKKISNLVAVANSDSGLTLLELS